MNPTEHAARFSSSLLSSLAGALDLPALYANLEKHQAAFLADLEAIVNLDSGTFEREDVAQVEQWLRRRLVAWQGEIVTNTDTNLGDSFAMTLHGRGGCNVMLLGHMDTVFSHGTTASRPFRIEGGHAFGPGTCDMKAGLLAAIYAVEALHSQGFDHYQAIRCVFTSDEEIGAPSSRRFIEEMAQGMDAVLVLEAGRENGDLVAARRGGGFYRLEVHGISAHAGVEPEKGCSAALSLAQQVVALHALTDLAAGRTVNVGTLQAGSRANVVPDYAVAEVDLRANSQADMERLLKEVEAALARAALDGTAYMWSPIQFRPPWERNESTERLVVLAQALTSSLGFEIKAVATGGTSDGNFTAAMGIPTLDGLGPVGGLDHGPREYVAIASIVPRTTLLAGLITAICFQ